MTKTIKELQEKETGTLNFLINNVTKGTTSSGAPYLNLTLQDKSGTIEGKLWDVKPEQEKIIVQGKIQSVSFETLKYRGQLQLRVHRVEETKDEQLSIEDFVTTGKIPVSELQQVVQGAIDSLQNPVYRAIVSEIFRQVQQDFYQYPAASKNHHSFVGGLATHTAGMLRLAKAVLNLYPFLNSDLLLSGILLHDIGKMEELSGAVMTEYTLQGKLLGHISIMNARIYKIACDLQLENTEEVILLRHLVLSHHGQYEYGSPVLPMVPEAEILSFIDNMDARLNTLENTLEPIEKGSFSSRVFPLENRSFYKEKNSKL